MSYQDNHVLKKFGIDEIYIHDGLSYDLLQKLYQRALFSLDAEDPNILKHVSHDMILIFHHVIPSQSTIFRFLKFLSQDLNKENFIKSNTLINEDELYSAIKSKQFILVTQRTLIKENYTPLLN